MWNGGRNPGEEESEEDQDARARQTASALAAAYATADSTFGFDTTSLAAAAQYAHSAAAAAAAANPPRLPVSSYRPSAEVVENLRRQQEEFRQQQIALFTLQQTEELHYARQLQAQQLTKQAAVELAERQAYAARQQRLQQQQQQQQAAIYGQADAQAAYGQTERQAAFEQPDSKPAAKPVELKQDGQQQPPRAEPMEADEQEDKKPAAVATVSDQVPRGKPTAMAIALAASRIRQEEEAMATAVPVADDSLEVEAEAEVAVPAPVVVSKKKRKRAPSAPKSRKKAATESGPTIDDPVPPITDVEYENVEALMEQFCRVPLLAEFSRPVSILHPELVPLYSKIVTHPIDLGYVCRNIRRRKYRDTRAIRLDMWRIIANCIKYHTHPQNKDNAFPSFVSIALHLRDFFNGLWEEYMLPSDPPTTTHHSKSNKKTETAFTKREEGRKKRMATTSSTMLSAKAIERICADIDKFIETDGRVDKLDVDGILGDDDMDDDDGDMDEVVENLQKLQRRLLAMAKTEEEYNVEDLDRDLKKCYTAGDLFETKPAVRIRLGHRIDRIQGKLVVSICEANSRGVNQSSIWGCMAAAIWARESSKKPYWPALVLGIMAPDDSKEDWHGALTERNERRLPEKLRNELQAGKRKAELAIRRQNAGNAEQMSYFLIEFMGTHEFIWVKETDMLENFDPEDDPNHSVAAGNVTKKKRSSRSTDVLGSKAFADALEEGKWALEEFELQLADPCGDLHEEAEEDEEQEAGYSYAVLCQSDDEADEEDSVQDLHDDTRELTMSETEETNELLATEGLLDYSTAGRKNAKKRTAARKKQKADAEKAAHKKSSKKKGHQKKSPKSKEGGKHERERRTKRGRERDRALKEQKKKRRIQPPGSRSGQASRRSGIADKAGRANAIVKAYLMRIAKSEDMKSLGESGVMSTLVSGVEATGLLGMSLAFRAAAGEIVMPERESGVSASKMKPWEDLDVDRPKKAEERVQKLAQQKSLLEEEIKRIKAATQRRRELTEIAVKEREQMEADVFARDKEARKIHVKRRKKTVKSEPKTHSETKDEDVAKTAAEEGEETKQVPVKTEETENEAVKDEPSESFEEAPVSPKPDEADNATTGSHGETQSGLFCHEVLGDSEVVDAEVVDSAEHDARVGTEDKADAA